MSFPRTRLRRLRRTETLRRMVRETSVSRDDLILPLFVVEGRGVREPVASMPGSAAPPASLPAAPMVSPPAGTSGSVIGVTCSAGAAGSVVVASCCA